ncbi:MAG: hypothetical protein QOI47_686 [Actinomycetota bacterium]|jgi:uncharacterized protein|nr:hypothetical protein [Actinomycetota bacterium]
MTRRTTELVVPVADLLPHPGARKTVQREAIVDGLAVSGSRVPDGATVRLDLELQAINDAIVAVGEVHAPWAGECRRCLKAITGDVVAHVQEIYEREPVEGETRLLANNEVDLTEMARDVVLLELPLAPLCDDDCLGLCPTCGVDRNTTSCACEQEAPDPRWAALSQLEFDE